MTKYVLRGSDRTDHTEWTLTEYAPGEDPDRIGTITGLTASEATMWADAQLGQYVELDWIAADGSALSLHWTAEMHWPGEDLE